jgi:hypothetical protein
MTWVVVVVVVVRFDGDAHQERTVMSKPEKTSHEI